MNTALKKYINILKALSDDTRLRIMNSLIHAGGELCVCEIMDALSESQYNISRHLKELKIADIVRERKNGRWVLYSINKGEEDFQRLILKLLRSIPQEVFLSDNKRLHARLSLRKAGRCVVGVESKEWERICRQSLGK